MAEKNIDFGLFLEPYYTVVYRFSSSHYCLCYCSCVMSWSIKRGGGVKSTLFSARTASCSDSLDDLACCFAKKKKKNLRLISFLPSPSPYVLLRWPRTA